MSKLLGNALLSARLAHDLTQGDVAKHVGVSRAAVGQWEKGITEPSLHNLVAVCELLKLNISAATSGMVQLKSLPSLSGDEILSVIADRRPESREFEAEMSRYFSSPHAGPPAASKVPILSVGIGETGPNGDFLMGGQIIDFVARPTGIAHMKDAFAIYVSTDRMAPRYEIGDIVFVSPSRPPAAGDDVLVRFLPDDTGNQAAAVRRLISQTPAVIELLSHNPAEVTTVKRDRLHSAQRIIPTKELLAL